MVKLKGDLLWVQQAVLPIECEIPSLKLDIKLLPNTLAWEEWLLYLIRLNEYRREVTLANKSNKKCIKSQYDRSIRPRTFFEGDLVLVYD